MSPSVRLQCVWVYPVTPGARVSAQDCMTQTYGFRNRPKPSGLEIHGDPGIIQSLAHMAAALYPPAFVQALLSTPIRAERHGDEGGGGANVAQLDWLYMYTGPDEPDPAGVWDRRDRWTALSGRLFSRKGVCVSCSRLPGYCCWDSARVRMGRVTPLLAFLSRL